MSPDDLFDDSAGARLFGPSGKGRPVKDWVAVPVPAAGEWSRRTRLALARAQA